MVDQMENAGGQEKSSSPKVKKTTKPVINRFVKRMKIKKHSTKTKKEKGKSGNVPSFPRHSVKKALRIPRAILEQNAGRACTDREAVKFAGIAFHGPSRVEISSSIKYGLLSREPLYRYGVWLRA